MQPKPAWVYQHPTTVSGVAVDESGDIATSCFDGRLRRFTSEGSIYADEDVSPGTGPQDRQCVAFRFGRAICGENQEYGIAIRDNASICRPADVPVPIIAGSNPEKRWIVRDISRRARYAVADDRICYNLENGAQWKFAFNIQDSMFAPPACAEDADGVWTAGPDGNVKLWGPSGEFKLLTFISSQGLNSVDANLDKVVVTDWAMGIHILDRLGNILVSAAEIALIHQAKFLNDGRVVYGTADGRLVCWDGVSFAETPAPPSEPPTSSKGKGKRK